MSEPRVGWVAPSGGSGEKYGVVHVARDCRWLRPLHGRPAGEPVMVEARPALPGGGRHRTYAVMRRADGSTVMVPRIICAQCGGRP